VKKKALGWLAALSFLGLGTTAATLGEAQAKKQPVKEVQVEVTKAGFEPAEIKAKRGEKVRLVVTRKVARTCATEIVMKDLKIEKELPLDTPVTVEFTAPKKPGELRYTCAMDMIAGKVVVE
jgi:plastocyanin domain-containing protein